MATFTGSTITKRDGGLTKSATTDRVICLIAGTTIGSSETSLVYNKAYELYDITDAETLGITTSRDSNNGELTHYHLSEMFRLNNSFTYFLILVDKTKTVDALVADTDLMAAIRGVKDDNDTPVNVLGFAGLNTTVASALTDAPKFQGIVTSFLSEFLYIDGIFVEGVGASTQLAVADYPDLRTLTAPNVHYVIAQDPYVAALNTAFALRASVGTVLGNVAARKVHEDLGSVSLENYPDKFKGNESFSLTDSSLGYWQSAALSDGQLFSTLTAAHQSALSSKGYIYVGCFANYSGYYLSGCPGAVSKSSDYAYFNFNCVWNKAARLIRKTLIPLVRSNVPTESGTGYIDSIWISECEAKVKTRITNSMISAGNCTAVDIYINPAQAVGEETPLEVQGTLTVGYIVHEFNVSLGLSNS